MTIERQFADHAELQKAFGRILKNQAVSCINCINFKRQAELCSLNNLRPPDRTPPRLASLSPEQENVVTAFLDLLAFSESSAHKDFACQILEEWWVPGALYRVRAE